MSEQKDRELRIKLVDELRKSGVEPFAYRYERSHKLAELAEKYAKLKPEEKKEKDKVKVAGHLRSLRGHGKAIFADLEDQSGRIQLFVTHDALKKDFDVFKTKINKTKIY